MNQLNGWQRIGVIAIALWGCFVLAEAVQTWPTSKKLERELESQLRCIQSNEYCSLFDKPDFSSPSPLEIHNARVKAQLWFEDEYNALPEAQIRHALQALARWILPTLAVYLVIWLTRWVIRGFRLNATSK